MTIGLTGKKRSGKNTVGEMLARFASADGFDVGTFAFADGVREMLLDLDPFVPTDYGSEAEPLSVVVESYGGWEGAKDSPFGGDIRRLLQRLGTECLRKRDEDYWTDLLAVKVNQHEHLSRARSPLSIITDVRFANEAAYSQRGMEDCLILVVDPNADDDDTHSSESLTGITPDYTIVNDKTFGLEWLEAQVLALWEQIKEEVIYV